MSRELTRQEVTKLVTAAVSAWTAYPLLVDWENREFVDYAAQNKPYAAIDLVYHGGIPLNLSASPQTRIFGDIQVLVCVREGSGTAEANAVMTHLEKALQLQYVPHFQTSVASPQPAKISKGWYCLVSLISFWYTDNT